jgi:hypothetical protein
VKSLEATPKPIGRNALLPDYGLIVSKSTPIASVRDDGTRALEFGLE